MRHFVKALLAFGLIAQLLVIPSSADYKLNPFTGKLDNTGSGSGGASGWTDSGADVSTTTASDNVKINQGNAGAKLYMNDSFWENFGASGSGLRMCSSNETDINPDRTGCGGTVWIRDVVGFGTLNTVDLIGNIAIGSGFANGFAAPTNGLIVEGDVGLGTTTPRGAFDVNHATTIVAPASASASITYFSGGYNANGYSFQYRIYSYNTSPATIYSGNYAQTTLITDDFSSAQMQVDITFPEATGSPAYYRVVAYNEFACNDLGQACSFATVDYKDFDAATYCVAGTCNVSDTDDGGFSTAGALTPNSLGPNIYVDSTSGDLISAAGAEFPGDVTVGTTLDANNVTPTSGAIDFYLNTTGEASFHLGSGEYSMASFRKDLVGGGNLTNLFQFVNSGNSLEYFRMMMQSDGSPTIGFGFLPSFRLTNGAAHGTDRFVLLSAGQTGISVSAPTAYMHLHAGSTSASTAPLKFNSGSLMTTAEAGAVEFLTDKWYGTITTGTARKELTLNDAALTSGRVPVATTNGRLADDSDLTFVTDTLTATKLVTAGNITLGSEGHIISTGTAPTVANNDCGTTTQGTVATNSTDLKGKVTAGTLAVTSCAMTFNQAYGTAPFCICQDDTTLTLNTACTATTTKMTITSATSMSSDVITYHCIQ